MKIISRNILIGMVGVIFGWIMCSVLSANAAEKNELQHKTDELITFTKEIINEKNYYSEDMIFMNEQLNYKIWTNNNNQYDVVLYDQNNDSYAFSFCDKSCGIIYEGILNGCTNTGQLISDGTLLIESVHAPCYDSYSNDNDDFDYNAMCQNIARQFKDDSLNSNVAVYAINSFSWNRSEEGKRIMIIIGDDVIVTTAVQSEYGFRADKVNYPFSKSQNSSLTDKYRRNSVGYAVVS